MILYHFCAAHMVRSILKEGLTKGSFPKLINGVLIIKNDHQWLTAESNPKKQSWATSHLIAYDRTDYRLTINIPDNYRKKLIKARDYVLTLPEENHELVFGWDGSDQWYIYLGKIPPKWIMGCKRVKA